MNSLLPVYLPSMMRVGDPVIVPPSEFVIDVPESLMSVTDARMNDETAYTVGAGWTYEAGAFRHTPGETEDLRFALTIPAGEHWVIVRVAGRTQGTIKPEMQGNAASFNYSDNYEFVWTAVSPGSSEVRLSPSSDFDGSVTTMQVVSMASTLSLPRQIVGFGGQSLMKGGSSEAPDIAIDAWKDLRLLWSGNTTNFPRGVTPGSVGALTLPLPQSGSISPGNSPAATLLEDLLPSVPVSSALLGVGAALGGSGLMGDGVTSDGEWNALGSIGVGGTLYTDLRDNLISARDDNPENVIRAICWAQGNHDALFSPVFAEEYEQAVWRLFNSFRRDLSRPDLPMWMIGPNPDGTYQNAELLGQFYRNFDRDSSAAYSHPLFLSVERPEGYDLPAPDNAHVNNAGQRIAGRILAAAVPAFEAEVSGNAIVSAGSRVHFWARAQNFWTGTAIGLGAVADLSWNERHCIQDAAADMPVLIGGENPYLEFDGVTDHSIWADAGAPISLQNFSLSLVFEVTSANLIGDSVFAIDNTAGGRDFQIQAGTSDGRFLFDVARSQFSTAEAMILTEDYVGRKIVATVTFLPDVSGGVATIRINGLEVLRTSLTTLTQFPANIDSIIIANNRFLNREADCRIYGAVLYSHLDTASEANVLDEISDIERQMYAEHGAVTDAIDPLSSLSGGNGVAAPNWILASGAWDDAGVWGDTETWNDSAS